MIPFLRSSILLIQILLGSLLLTSAVACTRPASRKAGPEPQRTVQAQAPAQLLEEDAPPLAAADQGDSGVSLSVPRSQARMRDLRWAIEDGEGGFAYQGSRVTGESVYVRLRAGYFREGMASPKSCVLFLEGLGDSAINHEPLFAALSDAGHRVIFFDYMGQGGSEGTMNDTRIVKNTNRSLQISTIAERVWDRYSQGCEGPRVVMGWSTGGLAAYDMARRSWADAVILIAPGIAPRPFVGEAHGKPELQLKLKPVITARTLTRAKLGGKDDPHVDAVRPDNPLRVPLFATNLINTSLLARVWDIPRKVKGLVLLSGVGDAYVDRDATEAVLKREAPHFRRVKYEGAFHELDNELPEVASSVRSEILKFLSGL